MIEFLLGVAAGGVLVKAYPPADRLATRLRDWLYGLFRKAREIKVGGTD